MTERNAAPSHNWTEPSSSEGRDGSPRDLHAAQDQVVAVQGGAGQGNKKSCRHGGGNAACRTGSSLNHVVAEARRPGSDLGAGAVGLGALVGVQDDLADPDGLRGDLDALVLAAELQALLRATASRGGISFSKLSEVAERMLVCCFSLVMLTSMSSAREFSPTIMPS